MDQIFANILKEKEIRKQTRKGNCPFCKKPCEADKSFKDDLSKKEFLISGLCQECQDKTFN